jgi:hypothetical protein
MCALMLSGFLVNLNNHNLAGFEFNCKERDMGLGA